MSRLFVRTIRRSIPLPPRSPLQTSSGRRSLSQANPIPRPNESLETKRSRLVYQSRKRGILETDLLLSTFAKKFLPSFDMDQLLQYDALLDEADWDIFYYATFKKDVPEHLQSNQALKMLQEHAKNEGKVILQMPSLTV
ncbi:unnamed protein product [Umbelopsis ramanniana]